VEVGAGDEVVVDGDGDDAVGGGHIGVVLDRIDRIPGLTGFFSRRGAEVGEAQRGERES
jgi:hypothetical protein